MPHYGLVFRFLIAANTAKPSAAQARTIPSAIRTFSPALYPGALESEGKREAVAVRAGAAVSPALGVAVAVFESVGGAIVWVLGADIDAVPLGRGVQKDVRVNVGIISTENGQLPFIRIV